MRYHRGASWCAVLATAVALVAGWSAAMNGVGSVAAAGVTLHHTLYISDPGTNSVTLFPANVPNPSSIATITDGVFAPGGLWVDAEGTLYVANGASPGAFAGTVTEYPAGAHKPSLTLKSSFHPRSVAVDANGNVYVGSNDGTDNGTVAISEYAPGRTFPLKTVFPTALRGHPFMGGLAVDARGDLYAAFFVYDHPPAHVVEFAPGLKNQRDLNLSGLNTNDFRAGLARDGAGNLYVGGTFNQMGVYPPGSRTPSRTFYAGYSQFFAAGSDGSLYVPEINDVEEFAAGASSPYITFNYPLEDPIGAAIH
jgi:hypothetical protein